VRPADHDRQLDVPVRGGCRSPDPTAARSLGTCTATRDAFWNCTGDVNLGGAIIAQTFQGQAHNNADCTGTIHYETTLGGQPAPPLDINFLILDGGDTIWGLPLNSGGVLAPHAAPRTAGALQVGRIVRQPVTP
jgi:hypothetical protein